MSVRPPISRHRAHGSLRALVLALATAALIGGVYATQRLLSPTPPPAPGAARRLDSAADMTPPAPGEDTLNVGQGVKLRPGRNVVARDFDRETGEVRFALEAEAWRPVEGTQNEVDFDAPKISLKLGGGQPVEIVAERARLESRGAERERLQPRRGKLWGNVRITIDRLSASERQALPEPGRSQPPGEERLIHVETDEITFDIEYSRVECPRPVRVRSVEAVLALADLKIRYNDLNSNVERLETRAGVNRIELLRGGLFKLALPGTGNAAQDDARPVADANAVAEPGEGPAAAPLTTPDGIPIFVPYEPKQARQQSILTYLAAFDGDVQVEQFAGGDVTGRLNADVLALLFDFGRVQRNAVGGAAPTGEPAPRAAAAPSTPAPAPPGGRMVMTWSGPLTVDVVPPGDDRDVGTRGGRMQVTASGRTVHVWDTQGEALCGKLFYDDPQQRAVLYPRADQGGSGESGVMVRVADGGQISGVQAEFNGREGQASVVGPGQLLGLKTSPPTDDIAAAIAESKDATPAPFDVSFGERLDAELGTLSRTIVDPDSGAEKQVQRQYLKKATFTGKVDIAKDRDGLAAEWVEAEFAPPTDESPSTNQIERLHARGDVELKQGDERITCREIDVELTTGPDGRFVPRRADARGAIVAEQGRRSITAGERMQVDFVQIPKLIPPFDLAKARAIAVKRGVDPDTIDWEAKRADYEQRRDYDLGVGQLDAMGEVTVMDPEQRLEIIADRLHCKLSAGKQIESAVVHGTPTGPASVKLDDFAIEGVRVEVDASRSYAEVPGAGKLSFVADQDLDGGKLDKPTPVTVQWSKEMTYRGRSDGGQVGDAAATTSTATFVGDVHAVSASSTFDSGTLIIDFVEGPATSPAEASRQAADWWILEPLANQLQPSKKPRRGEMLRVADGGKRRNPVFVQATDGVVLLTANTNPRTGQLESRGRIAGQRLAIDLRTKVLTIESAGDLLIEDYHLLKPGSSGSTDARTPFSGMGSEGPSQTYIAWSGSMSYDIGNRGASFERDVSMKRRSGGRLYLADALLAAGSGIRPDQAKVADPPRRGRDTNLTSDRLLVAFAAPADDRPDSAGLSRMSFAGLKNFQAEGNVYVQDSEFEVIAHHLSYYSEKNVLLIRARVNEEAELIVDGKHWLGPEIRYEYDTKRIDAKKSRLVGR